MKQVVFYETGLPENVLQLEEIEKPTPAQGEALIRITARNINPSDMMFVRGLYGITPQLPSSAGFEAAGVNLKLFHSVLNVCTELPCE